MDFPSFQRYQHESCTRLNALPKTASDSDTPARLVSQVRPEYPRPAFDAKVQGTIETEILISATGAVEAVCVRRPIAGLNQAAVECVRQWTFQPAIKDGK